MIVKAFVVTLFKKILCLRDFSPLRDTLESNHFRRFMQPGPVLVVFVEAESICQV